MTSKIIDWDAGHKLLPNTYTVNSLNGAWVLRITPDRKIEVNEDVEVSVLAQQVLDAVQVMLKPKEWQSLSKKEVDEIVSYPWGKTEDWVRAIDAKLREKNG